MIDETKAVDIAQQAIEGKVTLQPNGQVKVELQQGKYIVTFEHYNPPGRRGADYDARVTLDAQSGEVVLILGGS